MKRVLEYSLAIAIVALVASLFTPITLLNRDKYRAELRGVYERLQPGMARPQVLGLLQSGSYPNLRLDAQNHQTWSVGTPLEFGAQNWVLLIEFNGEHVSTEFEQKTASVIIRQKHLQTSSCVGQRGRDESGCGMRNAEA
jgi:hypothetical protein